MRAKIGFLALLLGGAGLGGPDNFICTVITIIGLVICLVESKKDVQPASKTRLK